MPPEWHYQPVLRHNHFSGATSQTPRHRSGVGAAPSFIQLRTSDSRDRVRSRRACRGYVAPAPRQCWTASSASIRGTRVRGALGTQSLGRQGMGSPWRRREARSGFWSADGVLCVAWGAFSKFHLMILLFVFEGSQASLIHIPLLAYFFSHVFATVLKNSDN